MFCRNDLFFLNVKFTVLPVRPPRLLFLFFLSGVTDLGRAGEGYKVKVLSSLELAACWERVAWKIDALERRGWGVRILILLSNSWFEFLSTSISCSFPHKSMERKEFVQKEPAT